MTSPSERPPQPPPPQLLRSTLDKIVCRPRSSPRSIGSICAMRRAHTVSRFGFTCRTWCCILHCTDSHFRCAGPGNITMTQYASRYVSMSNESRFVLFTVET